MLIKEVSEKFGISSDTIRYYEKIGVVPPINRKNGIRHFNKEDLNWLENAVHMKSGGVSLDLIIDYVKLYRKGEATFEQRRAILKEARDEVEKNFRKYEMELKRLDYKIQKYDEAIATGKLVWDEG